MMMMPWESGDEQLITFTMPWRIWNETYEHRLGLFCFLWMQTGKSPPPQSTCSSRISPRSFLHSRVLRTCLPYN